MAKVAGAKGTAVAVQEPAGLPEVYDYGADARAGFEGVKGTDLSIPFIQVLQSNSPQVEDKTVDGAESGMLFNSVTRELIPGADGVVFLPVHKEKAMVEWVPRTKGGGFVALHEVDSDVHKAAVAKNDGNKFGKLPMPNGNELIETDYIYGLLLDETGTQTTGFGVLSFTSTKIKVGRDFITAMYTLKGQPPMFANRARIKSVKQKNDKGTYYNFQIDPLRKTWVESLIHPVSERALLEEAKAFRDLVTSGLARAAFESVSNTGETEAERSGGGRGDAGGRGDSEKAPF